MANSLTPGPPSIEQAAQDIANRRRQEAVKQFEVTYAELLSPLQGSGLNYAAAIQDDGEVSITFSKPGIRDASLVVLPDGKLGLSAKKPLVTEDLTTYLAKHLLWQEELAVHEAYQKKWQPLYLRVLTTLGICFLVCLLVAFVLLVLGGQKHLSVSRLVEAYPLQWQVFKVAGCMLIMSSISMFLVTGLAKCKGVYLD